MIHGFTTFKHVLRSTISKLGLRYSTEVPYDDMIEWMGEALSYIGGYSQLENATMEVDIVDYKGKFPLDMYSPIKIQGHKMQSERGNFITDIPTGTVILEYVRFPLDDDGFPFIPDDPAYSEALMWYCAKWLANTGLLPNKQLNVEYCDSKWQQYCLAARAESATPTNDQHERMVEIFHRSGKTTPKEDLTVNGNRLYNTNREAYGIDHNI